ncbi:hypothetical protein DFS34DRAFT_188521 [Phlyctochytrium arcticum]|nr:hypothetical protein DFS34DRAFT_188521 [Phlyctochytrium arcticum]
MILTMKVAQLANSSPASHHAWRPFTFRASRRSLCHGSLGCAHRCYSQPARDLPRPGPDRRERCHLKLTKAQRNCRTLQFRTCCSENSTKGTYPYFRSSVTRLALVWQTKGVARPAFITAIWRSQLATTAKLSQQQATGYIRGRMPRVFFEGKCGRMARHGSKIVSVLQSSLVSCPLL